MYSSRISRREEDARRVAVDVAERALQEESDPAHGTSKQVKDPWNSSRHTVTLNTPPQIPTHTFPLTPFETPPSVKPSTTMRATAPIFTPPRTHTRTQSDLLPAIDLSSAIAVSESTDHRRTVSVESSSARRLASDEARTGDLPLPRTNPKQTRKAGMPTLAEITAYYATKRPTGESSSASSSSSPPSYPRTARDPSRRPLPPGGLAMLKRCSLSSDTSTDYSSSGAESDGPQTPPAFEAILPRPSVVGKPQPQWGERRESASLLPVFLRGVDPGKDVQQVGGRGGYNALATALARHRRPASGSSPPPTRGSQTPPPGEARRMVESPRRSSSLDATTWPPYPSTTPGIQVTPPSCTIPPSSTFSLRPIAPAKPPHASATTPDPKPVPATGPTSICTSLNVPGFRITPPTASAGEDDTSPLRRLEAEIAARQAGGSTRKAGDGGGMGRREERSERMMKILGKRIGGGTA